MADEPQRSKALKVEFLPDEVKDLPLPYTNAMYVQAGIDEFFVTLGFVTPPEITSPEDAEKYTKLLAKPLFRFTMSRSVMKQFIEVLQQQYQNQMQITGES